MVGDLDGDSTHGVADVAVSKSIAVLARFTTIQIGLAQRVERGEQFGQRLSTGLNARQLLHQGIIIGKDRRLCLALSRQFFQPIKTRVDPTLRAKMSYRGIREAMSFVEDIDTVLQRR